MLELISASPALLVATAVLFGLFVGSFLNVVIFRLPKQLNYEWRTQCAEITGAPPPKEPPLDLVFSRSQCPICHHQINALDNIPLVSYLLLGGKCRHCKTAISSRYPAIELFTGILTGAVVFTFGPTLQSAAAVGFTWAMIALTFIDIDEHLLPDAITLPLVWAGLIINSFYPLVPLQDAVFGAVSGYMALWSVYWLFKLLTGKEGMGYGDFKLFAAIGAWLGWQVLPLVLILSAGLGAVIGIAQIVILGRDRSAPIPFGPYLALGGWSAMLWGDQIIAAYLG